MSKREPRIHSRFSVHTHASSRQPISDAMIASFRSQQLLAALGAMLGKSPMGRNLYILAGTLALFAIVSIVLSFTNLAQQPGSPGDTALWRTTGIALFFVALLTALAGVLSSLFEQAERRADDQQQAERAARRRPPLGQRPVE